MKKILILFVVLMLSMVSVSGLVENPGYGVLRRCDVNGDKVVNVSDLVLFATAGRFYRAQDERMDWNKDGEVNLSDWTITVQSALKKNWCKNKLSKIVIDKKSSSTQTVEPVKTKVRLKKSR